MIDYPAIPKLLLDGLKIFTYDLPRRRAPIFFPETKLHAAALAGELNQVKALLRKGIDVNIEDTLTYRTPLHFAAKAKQVEVVRLLIEKGADVNAESISKITPLDCATESGCLDIVKILVEHGANIEAVGLDDFTILHCAAFEGHPELVNYFIDNGIDVNVTCTNPKKLTVSPLHLAALNGHLEVIKILIDKEANVNLGATVGSEGKEPDDNVSPLLLAVIRGHLDVVKILIESGANINAENSCKLTPLHLACHVGNLDLVHLLLKNDKCDANCETNEHLRPLHIACGKGHHDVVQALLKTENVEVNCLTSNLCTPLHFASANGNKKIVKLLVANGAAINSKTRKGYSPLIVAVASGKLQVSEFLLKKGAIISCHGRINPLYLYCACFHAPFINFIKNLIQSGVSVNLEEENDFRPLHAAASRNHTTIVQFLVENEADVNVESYSGVRPLHFAAEAGNLEMINLFLSKGADVNVKEETLGFTPLHVATFGDKFDAAKLLLMNGAFYDVKSTLEDCILASDCARDSKLINLFGLIEKLFLSVMKNDKRQLRRCIQGGVIVNVKNASGKTPLFHAIGNGNVEGTKLLLNNQADLNQVTNTGNSPLHIAVLQCDVEIVETVLQHMKLQFGPIKRRDFVNSKTTSKGMTALHLAAEKNDIDIVKVLLEHGATYNLKNNDSETPSQLSKGEPLRNMFNDLDKMFKAVKENGNEEAPDFSDLNKWSMNARDVEGGGSILNVSLLKGHVDNVIFMLENGADYDLGDDEGNSFFLLASCKGNSMIAQILIAQMNKSLKLST